MKKEINTLFALIRCAVFGETPDEYTKKEASEKAELLYEMARHHDLAHLLDYAYKINSIEIADENVAFKFLKQQAMSVMRCENLNFALENVSALFEKEKISFIPLKGAVIRKLYPQNWMRTSCDIDILVHEQDLDRAEKMLVEKLGYTSQGVRNYHDVSLYSDTGVHLELHFNIKENMENTDGLLSRVWEYASPKADGSYEYVLTNEFFVFQHVAHMSYHVLGGGCSIRYFIDLHLLEQKIVFDRNVFDGMLALCSLETFYAACRKLAGIWFSEEKHDETTLVFQRYLLNGGVYGTKMNAIAANSNKKSMLSYIFERIFMPYEQLCITYPCLKGRKILLPFYQVKRWFRFIKNRRYDNVVESVKANNSVSQKNTDEFSKLIKSLKLNKKT